MIKTTYDPAADALFICLASEDAVSVDTHEISPGVMLDYDANGQVIGIEVLDVRARAGDKGPSRFAAE
jgi:uncharacterized protein YuzE